MRKLVLILGFIAFSSAAVQYPHSEQEAFALQHSAEYQTLSAGERADVEGQFGKSDYVAHNNPTGEPVNVSESSKPATVVQRETSTELRSSSNSGIPQTSVPVNAGVVQSDVRDNTSNVVGEHESDNSAVANSRDGGTQSQIRDSERRIGAANSGVQANHNAINANRHEIETNRRDIKRVGAAAISAANLHYNDSESGYAVAIGNYRGETAIAGGIQFHVHNRTAATAQVSYDGSGTGVSVGLHSSF